MARGWFGVHGAKDGRGWNLITHLDEVGRPQVVFIGIGGKIRWSPTQGGCLMDDNKYSVEMNYEQIRVLNVAMDNILKHADVANSLYVGDQKDIALINEVAGRARATYQLAEKDRTEDAYFDEGYKEAKSQ
jgi:hypothetical protein